MHTSNRGMHLSVRQRILQLRPQLLHLCSDGLILGLRTCFLLNNSLNDDSYIETDEKIGSIHNKPLII